MTTVQLVIVCLTVLMLAVVGKNSKATAEPVATGIFDDLSSGQEVAVHVSDGQSVRGNVISSERGHVILGGAVLIANGGTETKLGGQARIASEGVALVQEL